MSAPALSAPRSGYRTAQSLRSDGGQATTVLVGLHHEFELIACKFALEADYDWLRLELRDVLGLKRDVIAIPRAVADPALAGRIADRAQQSGAGNLKIKQHGKGFLASGG